MTRELKQELKEFVKAVSEEAEDQWVLGRAKQLLKKLDKKSCKNKKYN